MVQFPGYRSTGLLIHPAVTGIPTGRVTPFGHLRITGCLLLPAAFRSLPRPSSPDSSKASTVDPCSLDHITRFPFSASHHPRPASAKLSPSSAFSLSKIRRLLPYSYGLFPFRLQQCLGPTPSWASLTLLPSGSQDDRLSRPRTDQSNTSDGGRTLEVRGLEPLTYGLQSHRSSQLSYTPGIPNRDESRLQSRHC